MRMKHLVLAVGAIALMTTGAAFAANVSVNDSKVINTANWIDDGLNITGEMSGLKISTYIGGGALDDLHGGSALAMNVGDSINFDELDAYDLVISIYDGMLGAYDDAVDDLHGGSALAMNVDGAVLDLFDDKFGAYDDLTGLADELPGGTGGIGDGGTAGIQPMIALGDGGTVLRPVGWRPATWPKI